MSTRVVRRFVDPSQNTIELLETIDNPTIVQARDTGFPDDDLREFWIGTVTEYQLKVPKGARGKYFFTVSQEGKTDVKVDVAKDAGLDVAKTAASDRVWQERITYDAVEDGRGEFYWVTQQPTSMRIQFEADPTIARAVGKETLETPGDNTPR